MKYIAYIGTYTEDNSHGIYMYELNTKSGELTPIGFADKTVNPSYVTITDNKKFLYSVAETTEFQGTVGGGVAAFSIDNIEKRPKLINVQPTLGKHSCHIIIDSTNKYIFVANYSEGTVSQFPVMEDGSIGELMRTIKHIGSGPNKERQEMPHMHYVALTKNEKYLLTVDLGLDSVSLYRFEGGKGDMSLDEDASIVVAPGSGPRHLQFHPNNKYLYIVTELSSEVIVYEFDSKSYKFKHMQTISTLPDNFKGNSTCAAIHINKEGNFLYASNRGDDSIAVYKVEETGNLKLIEIMPTNGKTPRDFALDPTESFLYSANQDSNEITAFLVDKEYGTLKPLDFKISINKPVCIKFLEV
ncbi:MAG TPA: lactonase family protein [Clostridiaceae bacterium]